MNSVTHDVGRSSVSRQIIEIIAEETDREPTELEPLYYTIEPECLEKLFPPNSDTADGSVRQFTFTYEDHIITISQDDTIEVSPKGGMTPDLSPTPSDSSSPGGEPEAPD